MNVPPSGRCSVRAWKPSTDGIAEVFHAHITDWGYPAHSHDTWTVLIVDDGAIDYSLDRRRCAAVESTVALLPPGVVHDGRPAARAVDGFRKRNLYLDADQLPERLVGAAVDKTVVADAALWRSISRLHDVLEADDEPIHGETHLALITERIVHHLDATEGMDTGDDTLAGRLRELIDAQATEQFTLASAGRLFDRSVPHMVRSFTKAFGTSPNAYLIARRIDAARPLLLEGMPIAQVATTVGFYDQAHFTRHFKRHVATTPGRYAKHRA
ncbi:MAG: AraC family transcriptional regulator [Actinomycetota bacterium]